MILASTAPSVGITADKTLKRSLQSNPGSAPTKKRKLVVKNLTIKPSDYVLSAFKANGFKIDDVRTNAESMFSKPSKEMIEGYVPDVLDAIRKNDLQRVQRLHQSGVLQTNGCNKFGESILHLACRRGYTDIVKYLLEEVKVDINARDDYNRNPLHDACWTAKPEFDLVDLLLRKAPHQLVMADVRGFTPFDYVRGESNGKWLRFLWERRSVLRPLGKPNKDEIRTASVLASLRK